MKGGMVVGAAVSTVVVVMLLDHQNLLDGVGEGVQTFADIVGEEAKLTREVTLGIFSPNDAVENVAEERRGFDVRIEILITLLCAAATTTNGANKSRGGRWRRN